MNALAVWKRLLWKEMREGWLMLAIAAGTPMVIFSLAAALGSFSASRQTLDALAGLGTPVLVVLWAARKGGEKKKAEGLLELHMPAEPVSAWALSVAAPAIAAGLLGAWYGMWATLGMHWQYAAQFSLMGLAFFATIFVLCHLLSRALSKWVSTALGTLLCLYIGSVFMVVASTSVFAGPDDANMLRQILGTLRHIAWQALAGASVGSFVFFVLARNKSLLFRRVGSLALTFIIAVVLPLVANAGHGRVSTGSISSIYTSDGSIEVKTQTDVHPGKVRAVYTDKRGPFTVAHLFSDTCRLIGINDKARVYLVFQAPEQTRIHVLLWDARRDSVSEIASFDALRGALATPIRPKTYYEGEDKLVTSSLESTGSVSRDGHYALVYTVSRRGNEYDLWLVNLQRGWGRLIGANMVYPRGPVVWSNGRATMTGTGPTIIVDLHNCGASQLRVPQKAEAQ